MAGHVPVDMVLRSKPGTLISQAHISPWLRWGGAFFPIIWEHVEREFTPQVLKTLCELQYNGANFNQRNVLWMSPAFLPSSL